MGLIVAEDGRMLLQHRDDKPGLTGAGMWGFFGGHVGPGEGPTEAFLREMEEELAWRPRHFELWTTRRVEGDGWEVTSHAYAAHLDVPMESLVLGEGQGMGLFDPGALPEGSAPSIRPVIAEFAASRAYGRVRPRYDVLTSTGLLIDDEGRFLLQHRDDKPGIANPGKWGSFGGAIEPGETPDEGFAREIEEELAWRPRRFELLRAYALDAGGAAQLIYVYVARIDVPYTSLVLGEGQGMGRFAPDALPEHTVPELRGLIEWFATNARYRDLLRD